MDVTVNFDVGFEDGTPEAKRFASACSEEIDEVLESRIPEATRKTTEKWVRVVREYVVEKKLDIDFEKATSEELGKFLESFYVEIRQKNGDVYSKTSMLGCRAAAIQRHLKWQGRELNIYSDKYSGQGFFSSDK